MKKIRVTLDRYEKNPILEPMTDHAWESFAVFNPGVCHIGDRIHLLYRAMSQDGVSVFGYASTRDGVTIEERLTDPVYVPREIFEKPFRDGVGSGCEDPRLTRIGDRVYLCYTAFDGVNSPRIALSSISVLDLESKNWNWQKPVLISPPGIDDKDAAIFPKKINGKFVMLHRIGLSVWIDFVDDLNFEKGEWLGGHVLMEPREGILDSQKIGICGPPIETDEGWLLLYHGISKDDQRRYVVRAALLDLKHPLQVLSRTTYAIFEPEQPYEKEGVIPNVVFPCGSAVLNGMLYVYYGGADKVVGVASIRLKELMDQLRSDQYTKQAHQDMNAHVSPFDGCIRPWGLYQVIDRGEGFQVKRIIVKPGQRLSYQRHKRRSEHWTIVSGEGLVTLNDREEKKHIGDCVVIPSNMKHRIKNIGLTDLVFVEVQNGDYLGEDDIERLEDDYQRE